MGVLSDFFIATEADAASYDGGEGFPASDYVQYKWITSLEAAALGAALCNAPDRIDLLRDFELIGEGKEEEGPWTWRVPEDLVARLADCPESEIGPLADKWASATTEELGWDAADFEPIVEDLIRLANRAQAKGKRMYLWNCL